MLASLETDEENPVRIKTLFVLMACLLLISACATTTAIQSGTATWNEIAAASCSDLRTGVLAASAAVAWSKIYFPNQEVAFQQVIEPLLVKASLGVDAYCAAATLVQDAGGIQGLLAKKTELLELLGKIDTFLFALKAS